MQELINKVSAAAGITNEQSQKAIETVAASLKEKLPHIMHEQIDTLINGGTLKDSMKNKLDDLGKDLGDAAKDLGKRAGDFANEVGSKIGEIFNKK
jgi:hypothetical protein